MKFRELSDYEINDSIKRDPVLDCSGAFSAESGERFIERITASFGKRVPKFRNAIDDDISHFKISFNLKSSKLHRMEYQLGKNFNYSSKDKIKYEVFPDSINRISLSIPTDVFNLPINNNELSNFISLKLMLRDGSVLNLKSSEGSETDPSSYSRMVFIKDHNYFGVVKNNKFKLLQNKILSNGIILTPE